MAQSLGKVLVHVVFSTKDRRPMIAGPHLPSLHAYIASAVDKLECRSLKVGGTSDHVHLLVSLGRTRSIASLVEVVKGSSSRWMCRQGVRDFAWQGGYGVFSVGESQREVVARYIANQASHHRRRTFQEELRAFLSRYAVEYDERYLWE